MKTLVIGNRLASFSRFVHFVAYYITPKQIPTRALNPRLRKEGEEAWQSFVFPGFIETTRRPLLFVGVASLRRHSDIIYHRRR